MISKKENFEQVYKNLTKNIKKELEDIKKELVKKEENIILNKKIKNQIAKVCLNLMNSVPLDEISIQKISYVIAGYFIFKNYKDELDEAISLAGTLELPKEQVNGNVFDLWNKMKYIFENYKK